MLMTTTDILQGINIEEYKECICCAGYESMKEVYKELKKMAVDAGANAIIGVHITPYLFDDILHFMGEGTPVKISKQGKNGKQ